MHKLDIICHVSLFVNEIFEENIFWISLQAEKTPIWIVKINQFTCMLNIIWQLAFCYHVKYFIPEFSDVLEDWMTLIIVIVVFIVSCYNIVDTP